MLKTPDNTTTEPSFASSDISPDVVEENLRRHVLAPWYPRAVDRMVGGFHQNYSEDWTPQADRVRSVVYQSRLTWVAAQAVHRFPVEAGDWKVRARHGADYLAGPLWDAADGGWFWSVRAESGTPEGETGGEKHAYGIAFGIYASAAAHHATGDAAPLKLAQDAFRWLETHAHDKDHGGYREQLARSGKPLAAPTRPGAKDAIGTVYGLKSMNTHIHLLEAFTALYEIWPDPNLRQRLEEVFLLVRDRITAPQGYLYLYLRPDWTPVPDHDSFGHDVETAFLLVEASTVLHRSDEATTWSIARRLMDHALEHGWDNTHGGFYDAGEPGGKVTNDAKVWWTQAEGLNALLLLNKHFGKEAPRYQSAFREQWAFITNHQIDTVYSGWRTDVAADGTARPGQSKSDAWKDPYHQGRALMHVSDLLRRR